MTQDEANYQRMYAALQDIATEECQADTKGACEDPNDSRAPCTVCKARYALKEVAE